MAENTPASDEDMSGNEGEEVGPTPPTDPLLDEEPPINQILFHARQIATHLVTAKKARKAEIGLPLPPDHRHDTGATVARSYIQDYRPQLDEKLQAVADITVSTLQDLSAFTQELALESQRNTRLYTVAREIGSEIREVIEKSTVTMSLQDMNGHLLPSEICVGLPENILRMEDSALAENLPLLCSMLGDPCFAKVMDRTAAGIPFLDLNHRYINYSSKKYPANPRHTGSPYQAKRARIEEMTPPEDKYPTKFLEKMNSRFGIVAEEAVYPSDFPARTSTLISPNLSLATTNSLPGDGGFETVPILLFDSHVHNNTTSPRRCGGGSTWSSSSSRPTTSPTPPTPRTACPQNRTGIPLHA